MVNLFSAVWLSRFYAKGYLYTMVICGNCERRAFIYYTKNDWGSIDEKHAAPLHIQLEN